MSWFKVSDDWIDHPKTRRAGRDGRDLWVAAGNRCARYNTDGLVERELLRDYAALAEVRSVNPTARRLVDVGLWHDHESLKNCRSCRDDIANLNRDRRADGEPLLEVRPGDHYFHQWLKHQPPKKAKQSVAAKMSEDRRRALLKDRPLCEAIQIRDQDLCRFCGHRVDWKDRRGRRGATYDHLDPRCFDPNGGNYLDGVVVACIECNGRKGNRTPAEWEAEGGLALRPPPGPAATTPAASPPADEEPQVTATADRPVVVAEPVPAAATDGPEDGPTDTPGPDSRPNSGPKSDLTLTSQEPDSGPKSPSRDARLGSGQVRVRSGPGPESGPGGAGPERAEPGRVGLGQDGPGSGLVGLVRAGPGRAPAAAVDEGPGCDVVGGGEVDVAGFGEAGAS